MTQIKSLRTGIKFKDTPIGKIPVDWEVATIEQISAPNKNAIKIGPFGSQLKRNELVAIGTKVYGQENVMKKDFQIGTRYISQEKFESLKSVEIFPGDVLITMMGSIGSCAVLPPNAAKGIMDSHLLRIQPHHNRVLSEYLSKLIQDSDIVKQQIGKLSQGGIMSGLNSKIIRSLLMPLPPLSEQKKISEIFTTVDNAIEETENIIEKTKELKKGLMQKLLTRGIGHKKFKNTEIGEMPVEWEVGRISDYGEIVTGSTPSTLVKEYYGSDFPFVSPFDLGKVKVITKTEKYLSKEGASVARMLPVNTILYVCIGSTIGKVGIAGVELATNQQINSIICKKNDFNFVYYYLDFIRDKIKQMAGTQAVPIVNKSLFSNVTVALPELKEQKEIGNILSSIDEDIEEAELHKQTLESLKKSLMQVLLTGRVRVKLH
ncbi:MAG: restriction endonuclease subunit S [Thermodesulfovibrio sp.]|nr:restriction endonuclease subunit S [Thermodesulfovibrio sp.]